MFTRRSFLQSSLLAVPGIALLKGMPEFKNEKHLSVQLYSVRDEMKKDPVSTLHEVAQMGYKEVEGAGYNDGKFYGYTPSEFKGILESAGLKMTSGHTTLNQSHWDDGKNSFTEEWKKVVESAATVGQSYIISPWIGDEDRVNLDRMAEIMNRAGEYCKSFNIKFGYHNHAFEFEKSATGQLMYDLLLRNTEPSLVCFEMDIYWVVFAKQDPLYWIKKHPGRFPLFHVKDMADTTKRETIEVGQGTIDFPTIFKLAKTAGTRYFIVELEDYQSTPMQGIRESLEGLKKLV